MSQGESPYAHGLGGGRPPLRTAPNRGQFRGKSYTISTLPRNAQIGYGKEKRHATADAAAAATAAAVGGSGGSTLAFSDLRNEWAAGSFVGVGKYMP